MKRIILASKSPRRKELLEVMGLKFNIVPAKKEEVITKTIPSQVVQELALQKAKEVYDTLETKTDTVVIGADTIVFCDGEIMGKPIDEVDAFRMIAKLQGNCHSVYTGVSFVYYDREYRKEIFFYEETKVTVYPMDKREIEAYIATKDPMDKAGGYGIQGEFSKFIQRVEGEYSNVVGLPIGRLYQELKKSENI